MKQLIVLFSLGLLVCKACALNLTPLGVMLSNDGPPQERYYFQDSNKRLGFRIDTKMTVSGSSDAAVFHFTDINTATMRLIKSPAQPSVPFTEQGPKSYETVARTLLPHDATKVQLAATTPDVISINDWKSVQFIFTYDLFGSSYRRAITFLNFNPTEQFVFDVSARQDSYEKVYARSYRVLNSIFDLPLTGKSGPS